MSTRLTWAFQFKNWRRLKCNSTVVFSLISCSIELEPFDESLLRGNGVEYSSDDSEDSNGISWRGLISHLTAEDYYANEYPEEANSQDDLSIEDEDVSDDSDVDDDASSGDDLGEYMRQLRAKTKADLGQYGYGNVVEKYDGGIRSFGVDHFGTSEEYNAHPFEEESDSEFEPNSDEEVRHRHDDDMS